MAGRMSNGVNDQFMGRIVWDDSVLLTRVHKKSTVGLVRLDNCMSLTSIAPNARVPASPNALPPIAGVRMSRPFGSASSASRTACQLTAKGSANTALPRVALSVTVAALEASEHRNSYGLSMPCIRPLSPMQIWPALRAIRLPPFYFISGTCARIVKNRPTG